MKTIALGLLLFTLAACTASSSAVQSQPFDPAADSTQIAAIVANLDSAWAHADAARWVRDYAPDARFINIIGMLLPNAEAVEARHDEIFRRIFDGSRYVSTLQHLRFLGPDAAVADVEIEVTGFSTLPPGSQPTEPGVLRTRMRHVLERTEGRWWIVASQNTAIAPRP